MEQTQHIAFRKLQIVKFTTKLVQISLLTDRQKTLTLLELSWKVWKIYHKDTHRLHVLNALITEDKTINQTYLRLGKEPTPYAMKKFDHPTKAQILK